MAQMPPGYGTRSPDGRWWWDGRAWQPVPDAAPRPPGVQATWSGGSPVPYGVTGHPGRVRSIGVSILLTIVTLGIYSFYWVYVTYDEMKQFSGVGVGGPLGLILYILLHPTAWFLIPGEVREMYEMRGMHSPVRGVTGLWILLPLAGAFVWFFKVQGALNRFWIAMGSPA
jgi:hypothetical protein